VEENVVNNSEMLDDAEEKQDDDSAFPLWNMTTSKLSTGFRLIQRNIQYCYGSSCP
jgi:hypothetical protein